MPMLKLRCQHCGRVFEELVMNGRLEKVACPDCGGHSLERHYQGKCYFGASGRSDGGGGGCSCGKGSCAGCSGCGH